MSIKIAIADDHQLVREGFKRILASSSDIQVVDEYSNGDELIKRAENRAYDVLLLDISMPGSISAFELIVRLRAMHPNLPILVVSMHNDVQIVRRALQAGATGYLDKGCSVESLLIAIESVANGLRFIDPCLMDALIGETAPPPVPLHTQLSRRESEILRLIVAGRSGSDIATLLYLSPKTVSTHKKRLMQKLSVENTSALIQYAMAHDLIENR